MNFRGIFLILFAVVVAHNVISAKKEYIHDCLFYCGPGNYDIVTFLCDHQLHEINYFHSSEHLKRCSNESFCSFGGRSIDTIHFRDCEINQIPYDIFAAYPNLLTLDISSMGLEQWSYNFFARAKRLEQVNASHNRLTTVRRNQFAGVGNLTTVDLSFNNINNIDAGAFDGGLIRIASLNLAHNAIQNISFETFHTLIGLQSLNLSHNQLAFIETGTFSALKNLLTLDVSFNRVKEIDLFAILPHLSEIRSFVVDGNPLHYVDGYKPVFFPYLLWKIPSTTSPSRVPAGNEQSSNSTILWLAVFGIATSLILVLLVAFQLLNSLKMKTTVPTEMNGLSCRYSSGGDAGGTGNMCSAATENDYATVLIR